MSTIISFLQDDSKRMNTSNKLKSKVVQTKREVEIKAPSIPSNRERIINVYIIF